MKPISPYEHACLMKFPFHDGIKQGDA